jgi:hypothetical protein
MYLVQQLNFFWKQYIQPAPSFLLSFSLASQALQHSKQLVECKIWNLDLESTANKKHYVLSSKSIVPPEISALVNFKL